MTDADDANGGDTGGSDPEDALLLAELSALLADTMPESVVEAASAFWTLRTLDAELAELAELDEQALTAAVRHGDDLASLTFTAADITIEIELDRSVRTLYVQVLPPQPVVLEVELARHENLPAMTSDVGVFEIASLPPGPVRVRVTRGPAGAPRVTETSWFSV